MEWGLVWTGSNRSVLAHLLPRLLHLWVCSPDLYAEASTPHDVQNRNGTSLSGSVNESLTQLQLQLLCKVTFYWPFCRVASQRMMSSSRVSSGLSMQPFLYCVSSNCKPRKECWILRLLMGHFTIVFWGNNSVKSPWRRDCWREQTQSE